MSAQGCLMPAPGRYQVPTLQRSARGSRANGLACRLDRPRPRRSARGAALLLALLLVALVATLASGMAWQQWRSVQVEAAERARSQSLWILQGAMDWTRLILREDARAGGAVDHGGEPWATPLAEARLSSFLAADRDRVDDEAVEAFLSGAITDAQARYNLRNLLDDQGRPVADEVAVLARLCAAAAVPTDTANRLVEGLRAAWARDAEGAESTGRAPLAVQRFEHLAWLGLDASVLTALRPLLDVLPLRTQVNVNSAPLEVLAAVLGVDAGTAQRLLVRRQTAPFDHLDGLRTLLPDGVAFEPARLSVRSSYFEARGRVRLETRMVEERALLQRRGTGEVVVVRRTRESLPAGAP